MFVGGPVQADLRRPNPSLDFVNHLWATPHKNFQVQRPQKLVFPSGNALSSLLSAILDAQLTSQVRARRVSRFLIGCCSTESSQPIGSLQISKKFTKIRKKNYFVTSGTSRLRFIISWTIDSESSKNCLVLNMDAARVSINAKIMLTSSEAEQYLQ